MTRRYVVARYDLRELRKVGYVAVPADRDAAPVRLFKAFTTYAIPSSPQRERQNDLGDQPTSGTHACAEAMTVHLTTP